MNEAGSSTLSRRERKKQETERRILDAARARFQARGYEATTVEEIAEDADVSRATVFNYFPTKGAILYEIAADEMTTLTRMVETGMGDLASPVARIRRVMHLFVADTVPFLRITRRVLLETLLRPAEVPSPVTYLEEILAGLVREAQAADEVRAELDPDDVARAIVGVYLAAFFRWIQMEEAPLAPTGEEVGVTRTVDMLFDGIAGPGYGNRTASEGSDG